MSDENSKNIGWFPYVLVVIAVGIVAVIALSIKDKKETPLPAFSESAWTDIETTNVTFQNITHNGSTENVTLPHSAKMERNDIVRYTITWKRDADGPISYRIIPDDCAISLRINDHEFSAEELELKARDGLCNYRVGFEIDLKPYLKTGKNTLAVEIVNSGGGPGGLKVHTQH